jgi:RNA polymerase sigma-70 factor (sigma-E family)
MGDVVPLVPTEWRTATRDERITQLFEAHYRDLCRLATLLLSDPHGAEEVVQEAFLKTFAGWRRIRQPDRAQFYLRTSVVNLCRTRLRRRSTEDRGNRVTWASAEGVTDPEDTDRLTLLEAVRALPERQREAVVLRYYLDLPEAEMAALLGCAPGTVKSQLSKARATLALRLGDENACGGVGA